MKRLTSRLQRWQIVSAVLAILLGGIASYSFVYYSQLATQQDRNAMLTLAVDGSQLASQISRFLDKRVGDLKIIHQARGNSLREHAAQALALASKHADDSKQAAEVSAFGMRKDCKEEKKGGKGLLKADTSGGCLLRYYASVSSWYSPKSDGGEWYRSGGDGQRVKPPPWVERAAVQRDVAWISYLDGRWLAKKDTYIEGVPKYTPTRLYEGVFHMARGVEAEGGVLVLVLDLDQAHIAEFVKRYSDKSGRLDASQWRSMYDRANYAYIVDDRTWIIAHPRPWHIVGWNDAGGECKTVKSITQKSQIGTGPLNFIEYLKAHPADDKHRSDDMSKYYNSVVQAVQEKRPTYGSGGNLSEHKRLIWAQPIVLTDRFGWVSSSEDEQEAPGDHRPIFGVVVVGNDLGTLSTALRYSVVYWGAGAFLVAFLVVTILRWTAQLAELDMLARAIAPSAGGLHQGIGALFRSFQAPVARLRNAIQLAAGARTHARARAFQKDVISQLVGPLVVLDLGLRCLRGRNDEPISPEQDLLDDIELSIRQLKLLVHESEYAKLESHDVDLCELLRQLVERSWPGRVDLNLSESEVRYQIPAKVVEDSVTELVTNAIRAIEEAKGKFIRPASWKADVRIELSQTDQGPIIDVLDRGVGIAGDIDPFDWGSSSWGLKSRSLPGMGLPCTRLRLAMFGAEITVLPNDSDDDRGAGFRLTLASTPERFPT